MYLTILDDHGKALPMQRISLFDTEFKISPARNDTEDFTVVNRDSITSFELDGKQGWAASLGVCREADGVPFAVVPLEHGCLLQSGERLRIAPGQLVISFLGLRPSGKKQPDPEPKSWWAKMKSRT